MTAVEWLVEQLFKTYNNTTEKKIDNKSIIDQANEMFKQQIMDAWKGGQNSFTTINAEKYYKEQFKNKEEPIQEILENLENQLKKVIKENPIYVNKDTYWRGVKNGLKVAIEVIKFKVW
jgi:predicted HAD superfamily Cof-like phosphohydrolase